jgi:hypothetical protein
MDLTIDLSVLDTQPAEDYHAQARDHLSSHQLMDFMHCPWLYQKKRLGLIDPPETPAMLLGRATHCRILEGCDAFRGQFALGGPINKSTGKPYGKDTQAFRGWCAEQGKPGVHYDDLALIEQMASGVAMNDAAVDLLLYGRGEGVVRTTYGDTPCQARFDWVHPHRGIVDLKTTAELHWFEAEVKRRRYVHQMAFYQALLEIALGLPPDPGAGSIPVHLVAVEKCEPFRCGVWQLTPNALAIARQENEAAIRRLRRATQLDKFPTGYEEVRLLDAA